MAAAIHVAHIIGKMVGGGVESVVMNYQRHIDPEKVVFDFIIDEDSTYVPRREIEAAGGRVIEVPPYQKLPQYLSALDTLFRRERYGIVHSHINTLSVFPLYAAKKAGVPVRIAHSHSTAGGNEPLRNTVKTLLRPFSNVYPTHRAACTCHAGEWLFGRDANFTVIPNAVELSRFWFSPERRVHSRELLGFTEGQFAIGHVGRFAPQKNQSALVRAFSHVVTRRPEARLVLVGDGPQRHEVEGLASSICPAGSVLFLGQRNDVADLYQAFDAFCFPSEFEGLGMAAIEAEAAGLPCVLSNAVPRDADPTGTARFLPANDDEAWSEAIAAIEPREDRAVAHSDFQDFEIGTAALRMVNWYETLAVSSPCPGRPE